MNRGDAITVHSVFDPIVCSTCGLALLPLLGCAEESGLVSPDGQADRADMYKAYLESALAQDTMVGAAARIDGA